jgi:hypothetical protein
MNPRALHKAAIALDALAAGETPDRATLLAGALALESLSRSHPERDVLDAAAGLHALATGGRLSLDEAGRERAGRLAEIVRAYIPSNQRAMSGAGPSRER